MTKFTTQSFEEY